MERLVWGSKRPHRDRDTYKQWQIKTYTENIVKDCENYFLHGPGEWLGIDCDESSIRDAVMEKLNGKVICEGQAVLKVTAVWDAKLNIKIEEVKPDAKEEEEDTGRS